MCEVYQVSNNNSVRGGPCSLLLRSSSPSVDPGPCHCYICREGQRGTAVRMASTRVCIVYSCYNPFRTAVPLWGQSSHFISNLSPKRDCGSKRVNINSHIGPSTDATLEARAGDGLTN